MITTKLLWAVDSPASWWEALVDTRKNGAGDGNRNRVTSLEG